MGLLYGLNGRTLVGPPLESTVHVIFNFCVPKSVCIVLYNYTNADQHLEVTAEIDIEPEEGPVPIPEVHAEVRDQGPVPIPGAVVHTIEARRENNLLLVLDPDLEAVAPTMRNDDPVLIPNPGVGVHAIGEGNPGPVPIPVAALPVKESNHSQQR